MDCDDLIGILVFILIDDIMPANSGPQGQKLSVPIYFKNLIGPIYLEEVPASLDMLLCENGDHRAGPQPGQWPHRGEKLGPAVMFRRLYQTYGESSLALLGGSW